MCGCVNRICYSSLVSVMHNLGSCNGYHLYLVTGTDLRTLERDMRKRKRSAFRPGTSANHKRQITLYISFCLHYGLAYIDPSSHVMCLYVEFLARSFTAPGTIRNYISGVNMLHKLTSNQFPAMSSFELSMMLRALDLTMLHTPNRRLPVTPHMLHQICSVCDSLGNTGVVIKVAVLMGYFGFLRQSNIAPRSAATFDHKRHTCRGDIIISPPGLIVVLKWTKTLQRGDQTHLVPLPEIPNSPACPVLAYQHMANIFPTRSSNDPLLTLSGKSPRIITCGQLRKAFNAIITNLGYNPHAYSLHSLRAGGATAAYKAGVDYTQIKRHGTWTSDSFWGYIASETADKSPVPHALADPLSQITKNGL